MLTLEEAQRVVLTTLSNRLVGGVQGVVIIDSETITKPYGWAFFYNSRKFIETGSIVHCLAGAGPVIVLSATGEVHELGSTRPAAQEIAELEKKLGLLP